jgi:hypothetical protein
MLRAKVSFILRMKAASLSEPLENVYQTTWAASVVWWSEFLATDPEARVRFPALPEKK